MHVVSVKIYCIVLLYLLPYTYACLKYSHDIFTQMYTKLYIILTKDFKSYTTKTDILVLDQNGTITHLSDNKGE